MDPALIQDMDSAEDIADGGHFEWNFVAKVMPRRRFSCYISLNLHWYNTSKVTPQQQQRQERNTADDFCTVAEFVDLLVQSFQLYYRCGKFFSVDEMCIFSKGRQCSGLPAVCRDLCAIFI